MFLEVWIRELVFVRRNGGGVRNRLGLRMRGWAMGLECETSLMKDTFRSKMQKLEGSVLVLGYVFLCKFQEFIFL